MTVCMVSQFSGLRGEQVGRGTLEGKGEEVRVSR